MLLLFVVVLVCCVLSTGRLYLCVLVVVILVLCFVDVLAVFVVFVVFVVLWCYCVGDC